MGISSITNLGDEKFLLKMKDVKSFNILVDAIKADFGYSFNQGLELNKDRLEIRIMGVSNENLMRHLDVVAF